MSHGYSVTRRDLGVLEDLARMRYLRTSQVQMLHFPSRRVANRRLEALRSAGYVDRFRLPMIMGQGSADYVYCLTQQGGELLVTLGDLPLEEMRWPQRNSRPKNSFLMEHHLGINDFWIAMESSCKTSGLSLPAFVPEYYGKGTESGGIRRVIADSAPDPEAPGTNLWFTPDAMFILERSEKRSLFFLEVDRGTEKIASRQYAAFADKIRAYLSYHRSKGFRRWGEQFKGFRVLVVTDSNARKANLIASAAQLGAAKLIWFTTSHQVNGQLAVGAVWQVPGSAVELPLVTRDLDTTHQLARVDAGVPVGIPTGVLSSE